MAQESPIPQPIRRGATPTGQIMREKPPTPPLARDRERSRSPTRVNPMVGYQQKQRILSSSVPPPMSSTGPRGGSTEDPAVNPSLYALRQSLYQKERERIGAETPNNSIQPHPQQLHVDPVFSPQEESPNEFIQVLIALFGGWVLRCPLDVELMRLFYFIYMP